MREVADGLSAAFATASRRTGAARLPAASYETGHEVGAPTPYVLGLEPSRGRGFPLRSEGRNEEP